MALVIADHSHQEVLHEEGAKELHCRHYHVAASRIRGCIRLRPVAYIAHRRKGLCGRSGRKVNCSRHLLVAKGHLG